jgi:hypothetical protein
MAEWWVITAVLMAKRGGLILVSFSSTKSLKPSGHYMYRTVVTICTAQWSLYVPHSGHYMNRTVVTICTAQWSLYVPPSGHYMYNHFNIHNSTFCPHTEFMCFVWISEQTAIISLYNN